MVSHIGLSGIATSSEQDSADAELDRRVYAFSKEVRCLVCQNETLADSRADLAVDLRREIREQMKAGRSDEQIVTFLTERYGDFVIYRPPLKPSTYLLWFGPFVLLAGGLVALFRSLKHWPTLPNVQPLSVKERRRIRQLLGIHQGEDSA
jgi:cytochrome c-type biogenesis protein CcmH